MINQMLLKSPIIWLCTGRTYGSTAQNNRGSRLPSFGSHERGSWSLANNDKIVLRRSRFYHRCVGKIQILLFLARGRYISFAGGTGLPGAGP